MIRLSDEDVLGISAITCYWMLLQHRYESMTV